MFNSPTLWAYVSCLKETHRIFPHKRSICEEIIMVGKIGARGREGGREEETNRKNTHKRQKYTQKSTDKNNWYSENQKEIYWKLLALSICLQLSWPFSHVAFPTIPLSVFCSFFCSDCKGCHAQHIAESVRLQTLSYRTLQTEVMTPDWSSRHYWNTNHVFNSDLPQTLTLFFKLLAYVHKNLQTARKYKLAFTSRRKNINNLYKEASLLQKNQNLDLKREDKKDALSR